MDVEKVNILVVDDLPEKLLSMEAILEGLGQNVVTAQSGREALRRLLVQDFAVILLDVNMPEMDGFETARMIRQRKKTEHTPIIFITGFSDELLVTQGYALGAVDYILSPVVPEVLRTKVRVFVDLYNQGQQLKRQAEERVALAREQAARAAAEEAGRHFAFLADASTVLNNSLDFAETRLDLLRLVVPRLADLAAVTLADPAGGWQSQLAWVDPGGGWHDMAVEPGTAPPDALRAAHDRALDTGRPEAVERVGVPYPPPPMTAVGLLDSALVLPLRARGHTLGVLTLARSARRGGRANAALAEDLAARAAVALDNARLYRDIQEGDRRKGEFLAMLGHELRNPLAPICTSVELMRRGGLSAQDAAAARDTIDRQVRQMVRLVDDLLDVARINRGVIQLKSEPVDLAEVARTAVETTQPLIDARRHALSVSIPGGPAWVAGDATRLAQVLANLLNNAAKYTPEGGRIEFHLDRAGGEVRAAVRDTGVGLPPEMLSRVFDLFTQVDRSLDRAQGGLGIGLTLARRLVELHGGTVRAASAGPGRGCEFTVTLPALAEPVAVAAAPRQQPAGPPPPRRVLVVDDNVDAAQSLARLLRSLGHETALAHDGEAALAAFADARPEVVFLDIGLPGMDGYEVARRLRERSGGPGAYLVALTGYGQEEDRARARAAGFDVHVAKPIDPECLNGLLAAAP